MNKLCQQCGKRPASTHVKRIVNGETAELYLCADCAASQGLPGFFGGLDIGSFWGGLFAAPHAGSPAELIHSGGTRCGGCGKTFRELAEAGKAGCPACYETFYKELLPSIQRIHGKTQHMGKTPCAAGESAQKSRELERLRRELAEAIATQAYERCAELRDRIRTLETGESADNGGKDGAVQ